ncbi:MAG TPA: hypothetical protein VF469_02920 [Kofleriaceae bacterium]
MPVITGWFPPPASTLMLGVGRQPNGFTCGTETFLGICEFLRLPVSDPDDDDIESYSAKLKTSARYGTDPDMIMKIAREYLGIGARLETNLTAAGLAEITNHTQPYVDRLLAGDRITRPLEIAMVTYQAYIDPDRERSWYYPGGRHHALRTGQARLLKIREGTEVLWECDWADGHWSAVLRVVMPQERGLLAGIARQLGDRSRAAEAEDGIVILGDPSNGEGLSFIPIPEFLRRWHDTDRHDNPRFRCCAVVLHVPTRMLREMRSASSRRGVPMFATVTRNAVIYVP